MNTPPPEIVRTDIHRVSCDGASGIRSPIGGPGTGAIVRPAALGHPRIYLEIDEHGYVDCGYCDRRFVLIGGPADGADQSKLTDISEGADPGHGGNPSGDPIAQMGNVHGMPDKPAP